MNIKAIYNICMYKICAWVNFLTSGIQCGIWLPTVIKDWKSLSLLHLWTNLLEGLKWTWYGCSYPTGIWQECRLCSPRPLKVCKSNSWVLMAIWEFSWQKGAMCWHRAIGAVSCTCCPTAFPCRGERGCMGCSPFVVVACCTSHLILQEPLPRATSPPSQRHTSHSPLCLPWESYQEVSINGKCLLPLSAVPKQHHVERQAPNCMMWS